MRTLITAAIAALAIAPTTALAAYSPPAQIPQSAQCGTGAGSGAFGAFGDKGDVAHDFGVNNLGSNGAPGADGYQTGLNNSAVCGNR